MTDLTGPSGYIGKHRLQDPAEHPHVPRPADVPVRQSVPEMASGRGRRRAKKGNRR